MKKSLFAVLLFAASIAGQDAPTRIRVAVESRDHQTAINEIKTIRSQNKTIFYANNYDYLFARLAEKRGDLASAMANYQSVLKRKSALREYALWHLSQIARSTGNLVLERNYLNELQTFAPKSLLKDAAKIRLARSFFESSDFASAIPLLQNGSAQSSRPASSANESATDLRQARENQVLLGRSFLLSGKRDEARAVFSKLIESSPNASQPDDFALAAVRGLDELDSNRENPGNIAPYLTEEEHLKRGVVYQFNRDFKTARLHYLAIVERFPRGESVSVARFQIGRGFAQDGEFQNAVEAFEKILDDDPNSQLAPDAIMQCASAYARLGQFDAAVSRYEKFIERYPDSQSIERAYLNIVDIRRDQGDDMEALRWADKTRQTFKGKLPEALALFAQARINISRGDFHNALANLRELEKITDLGGARVPGGTNKQEVAFLKAFALEQIGTTGEAIETYFSIPDGRNEYYGWRATERLRFLGNDTKSKPTMETKLAQLRAVSNQICESTNSKSCDALRIAAQNVFRVTNEPSALEIIRKAYAALPDYRDTPKANLLEFGRREILHDKTKSQIVNHQILADELLFLGLYDEGTPELEIALREKTPEVKPSPEANANSSNIFPADVANTLAHFYNRGDMSHRAIAYMEPRWRKIPADYQIEMIPRDQIQLLFPAPYSETLLKNTTERNLDPRFVLSIMRQESRFRADVKSNAAARGLMQFISSTSNQIAAQLGRKNFQQDELYNPPTAILFGSQYLLNIFRQFPDKPAAVAAAYNAGEGSTARWVARAKSDDPDRYIPEMIFSQTKDYVYRVMANYRVYQIIYDEKLKP